MFLFFTYHREEFDEHYRDRVQVEIAYASIKQKIAETIMSRNFDAQVNELLCKLIVHNITMLIQTMFAIGKLPDFLRPQPPTSEPVPVLNTLQSTKIPVPVTRDPGEVEVPALASAATRSEEAGQDASRWLSPAHPWRVSTCWTGEYPDGFSVARDPENNGSQREDERGRSRDQESVNCEAHDRLRNHQPQSDCE